MACHANESYPIHIHGQAAGSGRPEANQFVIKMSRVRDHSVIIIGETIHQSIRTTETGADEIPLDRRTEMRASATMYRRSTHRTLWASRTSVRGRATCLPKTEEVLVSRLRSGEEQAFEVLVTEQHAALVRIAMRYVANRETAEEVVQETWMAVIQGVNRFEGRSSLRAWICAILIHKAKDRGMREKRQLTFSDIEGDDDNHGDAIDPSRFQQRSNRHGHSTPFHRLLDDRTPEQLVAARQAIVCLQQAIDALPAFLKTVLTLRDTHGVTTKEICKTLNISESNLYVRLHRARERVRAAVEISLGR